MNRLLVVGLVVVLACTAYAGGNPNVRMYIDFDPPNYVHELMPVPYTVCSVYVCLDQLDTGIICVSFRLTDLVAEYPGVFVAPAWAPLLPGDLPISWAPWENPGATACGTECSPAENQPIVVGRVDFFYLIGSGCLEIRDHLEYPRWVIDCAEPGEVDYYCVYSHGTIGDSWCIPGDCPPVPVQNSTWGSVKSLYR